MTRNGLHPARSIEFLSRLHDGELSPGERARFETHRSHCDECRKAAAEFEAALTYFRAAGSASPAPDLATRILRKLESAPRRRSPFGAAFGIDPKWAGAFTAALVAVLIGYAVVERGRERRETARKVSVLFVTPASAREQVLADKETSAPPPEPRSRAAGAKEKRAPVLGAPAEPEGDARSRVASLEKRSDVLAQSAAASRPPAAEENPARRENTAPADRILAVRAAATERTKTLRSLEESAGGEGSAAQSSGSLLADAEEPVRITVEELDGQGAAPELKNPKDAGLSRRDAGRYVLLVDPQGVPIGVSRAASDENAGARVSKQADETLRKLRFAAADRPRRLLVRVE
jgi:Putative zinc-finger